MKQNSSSEDREEYEMDDSNTMCLNSRYLNI